MITPLACVITASYSGDINYTASVGTLAINIVSPTAPTLLAPTNGAAGLSLATKLSWNSVNGATSYDVYFGTSSPPAFVTTTQTSYNPGTLAAGMTYYWQILATSSAGTAGSFIWSFSTPASPPSITARPNSIPVASGSSLGHTTISWNVPGINRVEIHVNAPSGPLMAEGGPSGSAPTGLWVSDGQQFFRVDPDTEETLAR